MKVGIGIMMSHEGSLKEGKAVILLLCSHENSQVKYFLTMISCLSLPFRFLAVLLFQSFKTAQEGKWDRLSILWIHETLYNA